MTLYAICGIINDCQNGGYYMDFITKIKLMETVRGVPQKYSAQLMNVSPQNYSRKLKNRTFSVDELEHLANSLNFDMEITFIDRETGQKF